MGMRQANGDVFSAMAHIQPTLPPLCGASNLAGAV
jgi:hypothetical protein